jgi:hypothetical protein
LIKSLLCGRDTEQGDTPAAMMLIDRAVVVYRDFLRITGWVGNLAL